MGYYLSVVPIFIVVVAMTILAFRDPAPVSALMALSLFGALYIGIWLRVHKTTEKPPDDTPY